MGKILFEIKKHLQNKMYFKINTHQVKLLSMLLLVISVFSFAQKSKEEQQIDAQIETAYGLYMNIKIKDLLTVSKDIILRSEKLNYEKGLAYGNFYVACVLSDSDQFKESNRYLHKAQSYTEYLEADPTQTSRIYGILGLNYYHLNLFSLSEINLRKAIVVVKNAENKDDALRRNESSYYGSLAILHDRMGKKDSINYYLNKEKIILEKLKVEDIYIDKGYSYITFGNYFLDNSRKDSALYYLKKAESLLEGKHHPFEVDALIGLGHFYEEQGLNQEAIGYYMKAIETTKKLYSWRLRSAYKGLENVYDRMGNHQKAREYKTLYKHINDSLETARKVELDHVVNDVMRFEKEQQDKLRKEDWKKVVLIVLLLIALLITVAYYYKKSKDKNKKISLEKEELMIEKEIIKQEKEEESKELKLKINESIDELIHLAKTNNSGFFTQFQERYPEVIHKILEIDPKLRISELTLCAYVFLGFTTKDIALYTFKATNTVHSRKYNLRKKLNISSDENMELWLKNLDSN